MFHSLKLLSARWMLLTRVIVCLPFDFDSRSLTSLPSPILISTAPAKVREDTSEQIKQGEHDHNQLYEMKQL